MKMKRMLAGLLAAAVMMPFLPVPAAAESSFTASAELFFLEEKYTEYISIPEELAQSYQIVLADVYESVSYTANSNRIAVDENGLVTVQGYKVFNLTSGEYEIGYDPGTYQVTAHADSETFVYEIVVTDYAQYYAEQKADAYLAEHITEDMTAEEKLTKICEFVAGYDYSAYYYTMIDMIVTGAGGDCWASTATVNYMCRQLGMQARTRLASEDPGAGSGHRNSVVEADGRIFLVDAGYSGKAPRSFHVVEKVSPFVYTVLEDGTAEITEYLGFASEIVVPETIDGYTVTSVGEGVFYNCNAFLPEPLTSVTLPDTLTNIGASAFSDCTGIRELTIPANVKTVGMSAFADCLDLTLIVDENNPYLTTQDGILFTKDMSVLLQAYNFKETSYTVPEGVTVIEDCAFYFQSTLQEVTFPDTLTNIGFKAFAYTSMGGYNLVLPESVSGVGCQAFYTAGLASITFLNPDCVINDTKENNLCDQENGTTLGGYGYGDVSPVLVGFAGSTAQAYAEKYATYSETVSVYNSELGAFESKEVTDTAYYFAEYSETERRTLKTGTFSENVTWELFWSMTDGTAVEVTGSGVFPQLFPSVDLSFTKQSIVSKLIIGEGFESAEANALRNLGNLRGVQIPASMTEITSDFSTQCKRMETVYGYRGSEAETFAEEMGYQFVAHAVSAGDVNADGSRSVADAVMLQKYLLGLGALTAPEAADTTGDGTADSFDLAVLKRMLLKQ